MKQQRVSLTIDEVKSLVAAIKTQINSFEEGLKKQAPVGEFVRSIVEDEIVSLKKTDLYLSEIVEAERKESLRAKT